MGDRSVFDNVAFTLHVTGTKGTEIKKKVMHTLADVGLTHARNMRVQELSGGEQQRVAIARAFVHNPLVLLADEPTGNLDPGTSAEILQLLFDINTRGTAVIMATHNYELTRKAKQRILRLEEGGVRQVEKA
jgi:cell division transport system ATP-binding protein